MINQEIAAAVAQVDSESGPQSSKESIMKGEQQVRKAKLVTFFLTVIIMWKVFIRFFKLFLKLPHTYTIVSPVFISP